MTNGAELEANPAAAPSSRGISSKSPQSGFDSEVER